MLAERKVNVMQSNYNDEIRKANRSSHSKSSSSSAQSKKQGPTAENKRVSKNGPETSSSY